MVRGGQQGGQQLLLQRPVPVRQPRGLAVCLLACSSRRLGAKGPRVIGLPPCNDSNLVTAGQEACTCDDPTRKVGGRAGSRA